MNQTTRSIGLSIFCLLTSTFVLAQSATDLKKALQRQKEDTNKVNLLTEIGSLYISSYVDTGVIYGQQALQLATRLNYEPGILNASLILSHSFTTLGNYPMAINFGFKARALAERSGHYLQTIWSNAALAQCFLYQGDYKSSLYYDKQILNTVLQHFPDSATFIYTDFAKLFQQMGEPDSAYLYASKSYRQIKKWHYENWYTVIYAVMGDACAGIKQYDTALARFNEGLAVCEKINATIDLADLYNGKAAVWYALGKRDSAIACAEKVVALHTVAPYPNSLLKAAALLAKIYEDKNDPVSTLRYLKIVTAVKDSLFNREKTVAIQNLAYQEQEKQQAIATAKMQLQNRYRNYLLAAALLAALVCTFVILRNRRLRQLQLMRNRIADDLHDDIGSGLSSISIMNELAKSKAQEALPLLNAIGDNAAAIQENMSDIVWAVNPANDQMENVLQRMNQFAGELLEAAGTALDFTSDDKLRHCTLSMEKRKQLYLFFKEAMNNAAKYAGAKKVTVTVSKKQDLLELTITDDGKGFDTAQVFATNGMETLKRRAAALKATYTIHSQINCGTVIRLTFKMNR